MAYKNGDIIQLGKHRLMCGSSTNEADVERLMDGKKGKILFTSPPYANMRTYEGGKNLSTEHISRFIGAYRQFTDYQCVNLGIVRRDNEVYEYWNDYIKKAREAGYKLLSWNVWDKLTAGSIGMQMAFFPIRHEFIFVFGTEPYELNRTVKKKPENIKEGWDRPKCRSKDGERRNAGWATSSYAQKKLETIVMVAPESSNGAKYHPAAFPVKLPREYIQAMTSEGDIVIEPFCGSGSTLIACEQTGRTCFGMELEPKYVEVIVDRWEQLTNQKAELVRE